MASTGDRERGDVIRQPARFGPFEADPRIGELRKHGPASSSRNSRFKFSRCCWRAPASWLRARH